MYNSSNFNSSTEVCTSINYMLSNILVFFIIIIKYYYLASVEPRYYGYSIISSNPLNPQASSFYVNISDPVFTFTALPNVKYQCVWRVDESEETDFYPPVAWFKYYINIVILLLFIGLILLLLMKLGECVEYLLLLIHLLLLLKILIFL